MATTTIKETDDAFLGDHDVNELSFSVFKDGGAFYFRMAHERVRHGPFPTAQGAYLAAIKD